jgi:hypothetical protein
MPGIRYSSLFTFQADPYCFQTFCGVLVSLGLVYGSGYRKPAVVYDQEQYITECLLSRFYEFL